MAVEPAEVETKRARARAKRLVLEAQCLKNRWTEGMEPAYFHKLMVQGGHIQASLKVSTPQARATKRPDPLPVLSPSPFAPQHYIGHFTKASFHGDSNP